MNEKGFTLIETLAVITILSIIGVIIVLKVGESVSTAKNSLSDEQVNTIINATKKYVTDNPDLLPEMDGVDSAILTTNDLINNGIISNNSIINPKTKEEINGCVLIMYNSEYNQYDYVFSENDCNVEPYEEFFSYTGSSQTFTARASGYYEIELWGAGLNGKGGYTNGVIKLKKGENLYVYVGESGGYSLTDRTFNGGGGSTLGTYYASYGEQYKGNYSGSGATDIRLVDGDWDSFESLKSRIMVAGGGGIGAAGGLDSYDTVPEQSNTGGYYATKATQTLGGFNNYNNSLMGSFGKGSDGENYNYGYGSTGGGGGYYGGGGGVSTNWDGSGERYTPGRATGGSSFVSGHYGCDAISESSTENNIIHTGQEVHYSNYKFINSKIIDGNGCVWTSVLTSDCSGMPTTDGTSTEMGHTGNGYAKIKYLGVVSPSQRKVSIRREFYYNGREQSFLVPKNGYYKIELWGASSIGKGAYTSGFINLKKDDNLYIYVGEAGGNVSGNSTYNGGGSTTLGSYYSSYGAQYKANYNGGGATDVRLVNGNWDSFESLKSRIMVAAGGGFESAGGLESYDTVPGQANTGGYYVTKATQTLGGFNTYTNTLSGSFGKGSNGENYTYGYGSTSGGGGYYGGGGGVSTNWDGSGERYKPGCSTGGSSYISGHLGCNAISESSTENNIIHTGQSEHYSKYKFLNTSMIDGKGCAWTSSLTSDCDGMPTIDGTSTELGHSGDGYAIITYVGKNLK